MIGEPGARLSRVTTEKGGRGAREGAHSYLKGVFKGESEY